MIFLSILPQFARASATWPLPLQLAARPQAAQIATKAAGATMILVGLALDDASPPAGFGPDAAQQAAEEQGRAQRRGMTADDLQARYRVRWIPD